MFAVLYPDNDADGVSRGGCGRSPHDSVVTSLTSIQEDTGSILGLAQCVKGSDVALSCGVGHRHGLDLVLRWVGNKRGNVAPIWPQGRKIPYATGEALKKKKKKKK